MYTNYITDVKLIWHHGQHELKWPGLLKTALSAHVKKFCCIFNPWDVLMSSFQLYIAVFLLDKGIDPALYCGFYFTYMDILVSPLKKKKPKNNSGSHPCYAFPSPLNHSMQDFMGLYMKQMKHQWTACLVQGHICAFHMYTASFKIRFIYPKLGKFL